MTGQAELIERLRQLLADEQTIREVSMFGGRSFLVNGKLIVSALKDGHLLVRVATDRHTELLGRPGAAQAEMGAGRVMGPGWIQIAAPSIADEPSLRFWLDLALEHNQAVSRPANG